MFSPKIAFPYLCFPEFLRLSIGKSRQEIHLLTEFVGVQAEGSAKSQAGSVVPKEVWGSAEDSYELGLVWCLQNHNAALCSKTEALSCKLECIGNFTFNYFPLLQQYVSFQALAMNLLSQFTFNLICECCIVFQVTHISRQYATFL